MSDAPAFLASEFAPAKPEQARFHIIPAPLESSVSYGAGAVAGPTAILTASQQLETLIFDCEPGLLGVTTSSAIDQTLAPGAFLEALQKRVAEALDSGALPITLGGEHTVTLAPVKALLEADKGPFGVVQLDAHADLREAYQDNPLSHASVMRRVVECGIPLLQLGVRNICREEISARRDFGVQYLDAENILEGVSIAEQVAEKLSGFPDHVYVTFDVDAFDASLMPATGTPEPGGLFWWDAVNLLRSALKERVLIGADVVELAPQPAFHGCDYTAAKLVHALMALAL